MRKLTQDSPRDKLFQEEITKYYLKVGKSLEVAKGLANDSIKIAKEVDVLNKQKKKPKKKDFKNFTNENWFCGKGVNKIIPSEAEKRIAEVLDSLKIKYHTEVSFKGFKSENDIYYRFDFYIPSLKKVIEYDGKHHLESKNKETDDKKDRYCKRNKITVHRFNVKHWMDLEEQIRLIFV